MQSTAPTPEKYIAELPEDRKEVITTLRKLIQKNIPKGYEEGMLYGMISYYIPLERYPNTYNKQPLTVISLASQKHHLSLYLMCSYGDNQIEKMLRDGFAKEGKKLDLGKSCLRFTSLEELSLPTIEKVVAAVNPEAFIESYEKSRSDTDKN